MENDIQQLDALAETSTASVLMCGFKRKKGPSLT